MRLAARRGASRCRHGSELYALRRSGLRRERGDRRPRLSPRSGGRRPARGVGDAGHARGRDGSDRQALSGSRSRRGGLASRIARGSPPARGAGRGSVAVSPDDRKRPVVDHGRARVVSRRSTRRRRACRVAGCRANCAGASASPARCSQTISAWPARPTPAPCRIARDRLSPPGCDVLAICNDRSGVLDTLEELAGEADPLSQVRLVRLHGRPTPARSELAELPRWQECRSAVDHCRDAPELRLDA